MCRGLTLLYLTLHTVIPLLSCHMILFDSLPQILDLKSEGFSFLMAPSQISSVTNKAENAVQRCFSLDRCVFPLLFFLVQFCHVELIVRIRPLILFVVQNNGIIIFYGKSRAEKQMFDTIPPIVCLDSLEL